MCLNFHSKSISEHKSNYACYTYWKCEESRAQTLICKHLITSLVLCWVQMGEPNGTSADWRVAPIGCLWLSGRWSRVIILSLGGDVLTSYLAHSCSFCFVPHLFFFPVYTSSPPLASCSCPLLSSSAALLCSFLSPCARNKPLVVCKILILIHDCWWHKHCQIVCRP